MCPYGTEQICSCYINRKTVPHQPQTTAYSYIRHFRSVVMTGAVMGDRGRFLLTFSFLLMAVLSLEASNIRQQVILITTERTWSQARLHCQRNHIDLISSEVIRRRELGPWLEDSGVKQVWIGEHRDAWDWSPRKSVILW